MPDIKNRQDDEKNYKTPLMRIFQGGTGLGLIKGNAPYLKGNILGRADLWHGTPIDNMFPSAQGEGILNEGLLLEHAGKNKRLNSHLMTNSIIRDTETFLKSKKIKITPEIEEQLFYQTFEALRKSKQGGSVSDHMLDAVDDLAKKIKVNPKELRDHLIKERKLLGHRIYFGKNPESVAFWANPGKTEADYIVDMMRGKGFDRNTSDVLKSQAKILGESLAEQSSGGYYGDIKSKLKYGIPKENIQVEDLKGLAKELKPYKKKEVNVLFRSSVPSKTLDYMKDFPVLRHFISSSPGLKHLAGQYVPQNDPAKDLSIAENVSAHNINRVDIVDKETGKVLKRINVKKSTKAPVQILGGKGNRLKNLKKTIIPLASTAIGTDLLYNAITNRSLGSDIKDLFSHEKKAAVDPKTLLKTVMFPAGFVASVLGGNYLARKALGVDLPEVITTDQAKKKSLKDNLRIQIAEADYLRKTLPLTKLISGTVGAGIGLGLSKTRNPIGAVIGGGIGSILGDIASATPAQTMMTRTDPEHSGMINKIIAQSESGKKFLKDHPELASNIQTIAMTGAATGLPYYIAKKYYPFHAKGIGLGLKKAKDALDSKSKKSLSSILPALGAAIVGPAAVSHLALTGQSLALRGARKALKEVEKINNNEKLEKK